jgi:hypothetical protein
MGHTAPQMWRRQDVQLTEAERDFAERLLDRYEKSARNWPRTRFFCLLLGCFLLVWGSFLVARAITNARNLAAREVLSRDEVAQMPSGPRAELWLLGALLKATKIQSLRARHQLWLLMEASIGIVLDAMGIALLTLLAARWRTHERDLLLGKILRQKWEEEFAAPARLPRHMEEERGSDAGRGEV